MLATSIKQKRNDLFRQSFFGGKVVMTRAVSLSPSCEAILEAVKNFADFSPDNDPYGEHDFGAVLVDNEKYFWKIDYYDEKYEYYQEDGNRVLTIMHASEY